MFEKLTLYMNKQIDGHRILRVVVYSSASSQDYKLLADLNTAAAEKVHFAYFSQHSFNQYHIIADQAAETGQFLRTLEKRCSTSICYFDIF